MAPILVDLYQLRPNLFPVAPCFRSGDACLKRGCPGMGSGQLCGHDSSGRHAPDNRATGQGGLAERANRRQTRRSCRADAGPYPHSDPQSAGRKLPRDLRISGQTPFGAWLCNATDPRGGCAGRLRGLSALEHRGAARGRATGPMRAFQLSHRCGRCGCRLDLRPVRRAIARRQDLRARQVRKPLECADIPRIA